MPFSAMTGASGAATFWSGPNTLGAVSGTTGQVLTSNGASAPTFAAIGSVLGGTTVGDMLYVASTGPVTYTRLGVGTAGQTLSSTGTVPTWTSSAAGSLPVYSFSSTDFENPNNSDWTSNSLATAEPDPSNSGLTVRKFVTATANAVGFTRRIPSGATNMSMTFVGRVLGNPCTKYVGINLSKRVIPNGSSALSWVTGYNINISFPSNTTYFQTFTVTDTLANLGLTVNNLYQFSMHRQTPTVGSNIAFNYLLVNLYVSFS
jgi:hypothetical protein